MTHAAQRDSLALRMDPDHSCVWIGTQRVALRPTPFAIAQYFAEHAGQLVSKEEMLQAVWPDTRVNSAVLKAYIQQLRKALGDDAKAPRFIETVQRRGYRFIGAVVSSQHSVASSPFSPPTPDPRPLIPTLVGRDTELARLRVLLAKAAHGERQFVFVTGEPGIGKTAAVNTILTEKGQGARNGEQKDTTLRQPIPVPRTPIPGLWVARGQCVEHYGEGEAYLPILEALGRLCRGPRGERSIALLRQYAPTWLLQIPWLLRDGEIEALRQRTQGGTPARMLRECAAFIEALTGPETDGQTLVLVLEDLHWSDSATLELLSSLVRRQESARLFVIGTYRPQEVTRTTPMLLSITRELLAHGHGEEVQLPLLDEHAVTTYVTRQFATLSGASWSLPDMVRTIYERTEGNPLFMVSMVRHLLMSPMSEESASTSLLASAPSGIPSNLRQLIEKQFTQQPLEEQRLLESASVVGLEFSTAAVAAGLAGDEAEVERRCSVLAQQGLFVHSRGILTWPDGTVTGHYSFAHALYRQVLLGRLAPGWRAELHRRIGERLESGFGGRAAEIAAELVLHFEQGQEFQRVIPYCIQAAQTVLGRFAYREVVLLLDKGLAALRHLPVTQERDQQEVMLLAVRVSPFLALEGYGSEEAFRTLTRARELCERYEHIPFLSYVYSGLAAVTLIRGDLPSARTLGEQALALAQQSGDSLALIWAYLDVGEASLFHGNIAQGHEHFLQGRALAAALTFAPETSLMDPGIVCTSMSGWSFFALGYADRALAMVRDALDRARKSENPYTLAMALTNAGAVYGMWGEGRMAEQLAQELRAIAREQNMPFWAAWGTTLLGAAFALQGHYSESRRVAEEGIAAQRAVGCRSGQAGVLAFVAESCAQEGQVEAGLAIIAQAEDAMRTTGEYFWQPRLLQIKGELLRNQPGAEAEAETILRRALDVARSQGAKFTELQAMMSLCRLWQKQGKQETAKTLLANTYQWFTEGFDTVPLREAKALLDALR